MGSYLLDILYYKQTLHGLSALMKFMQLNTVFLCSTFCKVCIMEEYSQKCCKKYPLSAVPCKRRMYRSVVNFQIKSLW
jgi:hypothetical protein